MEINLLHFRSCSRCLWLVDAFVIQTHVVRRSPAHVQWPCSRDGDKSHSMMLSPVGKGHLLPLTVVHNMEVVLRVTFRDIRELFRSVLWILPSMIMNISFNLTIISFPRGYHRNECNIISIRGANLLIYQGIGYYVSLIPSLGCTIIKP